MANLTEDMFDMIDDELKAFGYLTPQKKASRILQDFKDSKLNEAKIAKAKTKVEEDLYDFHRMRLYTRAQREIGLLNSDEMSVYLGLLSKEIVKDLENEKSLAFGKMLDKLNIYNSAIFLLTEHFDNGKIIKPKVILDDQNKDLLFGVEQRLGKLKEKICDIDKVM